MQRASHGTADIRTDSRRAPPRVLVAEDSEDVRDLLTAALESDGYEVISFADGTALVDYLRTLARNPGDSSMPDLIISDICMPGSSGIDVLSAIRREHLQVPVILMTGYGSAGTDAEVRRLGAATLFSKPFDLDDLRTALLYYGRR